MTTFTYNYPNRTQEIKLFAVTVEANVATLQKTEDEILGNTSCEAWLNWMHYNEHPYNVL